MILSRRARTASVVVLTVLSGVLAGDVAGLSGCRDGCRTASASAAVPAPAVGPAPVLLGLWPFEGATGVSPLDTAVAEIIGGRITAVSLADEWGNPVEGAIASNGASWSSAGRLRFARTYTMTVDGVSAAGLPLTRSAQFDTATPTNYVHPYIEVQGGFAANPDVPYGVATILQAHFDEPIADKALAEKNMIVRTEPPTPGSWNWISDTVAQWRPENYYVAGTRIDVDLNMFGLKLGEGLYGQADAHSTLTIGAAHLAVANDITKQVSVFDNGRLVRTMPTSMGRGGTATVAGKNFSWWTPPGVYTVLDKGEVVTMNSATYGLPVNSEFGYNRKIGWATRISTDGIYLHQLDDTVWAQGNTNLSHGCLNLSGANAKWFYDFAQPGDPVEVRYTGGPTLTVGQGGSWSVPWQDWTRGSALNPQGQQPPARPGP